MDARVGAHADLLCPLGDHDVDQAAMGGNGDGPMADATPAIYGQEAGLGFAGALSDADGFWSQVPASAARIDTPEPWINAVIRQSLRFREMTTSRDRKTGEVLALNDTYRYQLIWATQTAIECGWAWDMLGQHAL